MANLYDPQVVKRLFDEMAHTYGLVNLLSSFGFTRRWRRQCLSAIRLPPAARAIDMMSGMGELSRELCRLLGIDGQILAIDISETMARKAAERRLPCTVRIVQADVLHFDFEPGSADVVVSSFGLKTFSAEHLEVLAATTARVLKPGGVFSFIEVSVPPALWLRAPFMFYLNRIIPIIGALFLGNPDNYRQLGIYTTAFGDCREALRLFQSAGLEARYQSFFLGCATGISGRRPTD